MPLKRRTFVQRLLVTPAVPAALAARQAVAPKEQAAAPPPQATGRVADQQRDIPLLQLTHVDLAAEMLPHFFTPGQFATLQALGKIMVPAMKGNPSAQDAHAPEFLDFLISVSPAERQTLYRDGLDGLSKQSEQKFQKPFAQLSAAEADQLLKPLLVVRPWPQDFPSDPAKKFVAQVHDDLRAATANSREAAEVAAKSGRRFTRGRRGAGLYWSPVDPIV